MVAQAHEQSRGSPPAGASHRGPGRRGRSGLRRLLSSVVRVVDLQYHIWLTQAKLTLMRMAVYAALFAGALVLGILAVIFLCIGVFHILTDVVGLPSWAAFLIFGAGLALIAGVLVAVATRMLSGQSSSAAQKVTHGPANTTR